MKVPARQTALSFIRPLKYSSVLKDQRQRITSDSISNGRAVPIFELQITDLTWGRKSVCLLLKLQTKRQEKAVVPFD